MKIHEYNDMMSWLTRPARVGFSRGTTKVASLEQDVVPGALRDELLKDFDPSQETYEDYLQRKSLERPFNSDLGPGGYPLTASLKNVPKIYSGVKTAKKIFDTKDFANPNFFKTINDFSLKNFGGNLKAAVRELSGEAGKKLESLYSGLTQAAKRKNFTFDTAGQQVISNIPQVKNPIKFREYTTAIRENTELLDTRVNSLVKDKIVAKNNYYNKDQLMDILGVEKGTKRSRNFFVEVLKDNDIPFRKNPAGFDEFKLDDVIKVAKKYSRGKLRNWESRSIEGTLRKSSVKKLKLRTDIDPGLVNFNHELNKGINKNLSKVFKCFSKRPAVSLKIFSLI